MNDKYKIIIEKDRIEKNYWSDLWRFRDLFYILSWRDLSVRYKQTVIGILWALIQPLLTMGVFTIVFSKIANLPSDGNAPYAIMVYVGMLPWQFFASSITATSNSLIGNTQLITKVYFPRLIIPASSMITSFVDFLISFVILIFLMFYYSFFPSWEIIFVFGFLLLAFLTALGTGLFITSLNVKYRDFRYIVPFIVQLGLYISPVGFSSSVIPEQYRFLYSLNPMVGVIDGFRWSILGGNSNIYIPGFLLSIFVAVIFLIMGFIKFRKMEKSFADII
jgi:lipopolysaccharide transport system permease protein